ncbi:hypothetical protein IT400_04125 [Candidatus Nomurabacteria bacterium]|nr:hypothetical protein [Candidatus Nomurabacteria bacterium]
MKILGIILGFFIGSILLFQVFVEYRFHFKPAVNFLVKNFLPSSCNGKKDCDELRVLPKVLQGKKIVFNPDTNVFFEPFSRNAEVNISHLDTIGFLDTSNFDPNADLVDPTLNHRGSLKDREYIIIRSVYHYKCTYCIDSSDYSFIVLEDSNGNRFVSLLNRYDSSVDPGRLLSWDEYLPFYLGNDNEGKDRLEAKLVNIQ